MSLPFWSTVILLLCLPMANAEVGETREWVSNDGRKLSGKLLAVSEEEIQVLARGKQLKIPVSRLSKEDQEFVVELLAKREEDEENAARANGFKEGKYANAVKGKWVKYGKEEHGLIFQLYIGREVTRKKAGPLVPLFIHLHGAAGRSDDIEVGQVEIAAEMMVKEDQYGDMPCVVCVPLCPPEPQTWGKQTKKLEAIVDDLVANLPIDRSRIYLSGYSQGAAGIGSMISSRPTTYAAAMFADGRLKDQWLGTVKTSMWFYFSGERDSSKVEAAQAKFANDGVELKCDSFPEVDHNSIHWKMAKEPKVFEWLFEQRLPSAP